MKLLLANAIACNLNGIVSHAMGPILQQINFTSTDKLYFRENYGIISMLPFLLLYALPTVMVFSAIFTFTQKTGILNRASHSLNNLFMPFGVGVAMILFALSWVLDAMFQRVIATRSCSVCTRGNCTISFGSGMLYQLPATLAIFSAAGKLG